MTIPADIEIALERAGTPKQWRGMIGAILTASHAMGESATSDRDALLAMFRTIFDNTHKIIKGCGADADLAAHGMDIAEGDIGMAFSDLIEAEEDAPAYRQPYSTMNHAAQGIRT